VNEGGGAREVAVVGCRGGAVARRADTIGCALSHLPACEASHNLSSSSTYRNVRAAKQCQVGFRIRISKDASGMLLVFIHLYVEVFDAPCES